MIVSVHIHKNGGMEFKNFLLKSFGQELLLEYGKDSDVLKRFFSGGKRAEPKLEEHAQYKIVHGHFLANRFDKFENVKLITFLREPAQRVVSNYYFFKRNFYNHNPICHMIKDGLTLDEYVDLDSSKNVQSFFLANKTIEDFYFAGILEEYDASIVLLKKILNIKFNVKSQSFYYKKYFEYLMETNKSNVMTFDKFSGNKNKDKKDYSYEIPAETLEKIQKNNILDYELYKSAQIKFHEMKEEYDI